MYHITTHLNKFHDAGHMEAEGKHIQLIVNH